MEETNITISKSGSNKINLEKEMNTVQDQTIVTALTGLIFISLGLALYFFFTQKSVSQVSHTATDKIENVLEPSIPDERTPKVLIEGSRTLESELIEPIPATTANTEAPIKTSTEANRHKSIETTLDQAVLVADAGGDVIVETEEDPVLFTQKPITGLTENELRRQQNQIKLFCAKVGEKLGSVSVDECLQYEFAHGGAVSNEKTPITYLDYKSNNEKPIKVLLFGGIHGDEFSAVSIIFRWLRFLENEYAQDSNQNIHWRVVPVLNPDGLLQPDGKSKRMNANNIDLNRNFPTPDWEQDALRFWKEKTGENERRYPGKHAASEIETQWVLSQLETFKPDAVISVHAPFGIVDADGPVEPPQKLGPLELKLLGTYPGSMGRYIGVHKNLPMLTVELERAGSMPKKEDIEHIWLDIQDWVANKVQDRDIVEQAEMQSLRREESDNNGSTVIDKKGGD